MGQVKRVVLDVLKPHTPSSLDFAHAITEIEDDYRVKITVVEMDEKTETVLIEIAGNQINLDQIQATITDLGGSLHSIDEVEVHSLSKA